MPILCVMIFLRDFAHISSETLSIWTKLGKLIALQCHVYTHHRRPIIACGVAAAASVWNNPQIAIGCPFNDFSEHLNRYRPNCITWPCTPPCKYDSHKVQVPPEPIDAFKYCFFLTAIRGYGTVYLLMSSCVTLHLVHCDVQVSIDGQHTDTSVGA